MDFAGLSSFLSHDYISISTEASNWQSQETEYYSATLKNVMLQETSDSEPHHRSRQHDTTTSIENMEYLPSGEEVVGIITLEDVMEELLQVNVTDYSYISSEMKYMQHNIEKVNVSYLDFLNQRHQLFKYIFIYILF